MYNEILEGFIMEYLKGKDFVSDFAERTLANLEKIENEKSDDAKYEVTQLINSLLGLIVFPKERKVMDDEWGKALAKYIKIPPKFNVEENKIIQHMRNAISHSHIFFESGNILDKNGKKQITSIKFFDCKKCEKKNQNLPCKNDKDCTKCIPGDIDKIDFLLTIPIDDLRSCVKTIANDLIKMKGSTTK